MMFVRNKDGSLTTTMSALRRIFVMKILDALPIDIDEIIEQRLQEIIQKATGSEDGSFEAVTISKEKNEQMLIAVDELINIRKEALKPKEKDIQPRIIKRCGRYALLERETQYSDQSKFIVACGYNDKTGEWNQGYYFNILQDEDASTPTAMKEFNELSGYACAKCEHINDGCTYCKK